MAGRPDVRVRLSAEGVGEVVSALKRVQAQGQKTASKQAAGFGGFNRVLGSTTKLLGGLVGALGVYQLVRFLGRAIQVGDELNKLSLKVGATTENLSALALVARLADSNLQQVGTALIRMNKFVGDAAAGLPTAVAGLRDLGLGVDSFKGKDSVEMFELVSKRVIELGDNFRRRRSAVQIFGRAGAQLIPTMKALADEGLLAVIERARELGVLIDHDLAASMERLKDDMEILKMQSESIGVHFMAGFGPQLSQMLQTVSGNLGDTVKAWEEFGQGLGVVLTYFIGGLASGLDIARTYLGAFIAFVHSGGKAMRHALRGDMDAVNEEIRTFNRFWDNEMDALEARLLARGKMFTLPIKPPSGSEEGGADVGGASEEELAEAAAKRAQAMQMALDRELALARVAATLKQKEERRAFDEGLTDIVTFYDRRRAIAEAAYAEEVRVLKEKESYLAAIVDPGMRLQEEEKIKAEARKKEITHADEMAQLAFDEREAVRDLTQERLDLEVTLLEMQGKRVEAERLGIEEQLRLADLVLRKQGASDAAREAALARLREGLEAGVDFEAAKRDAEAALTSLEGARRDIDARVEAGLLTQYEAEVQILALEQARIETLRELAAAMEDAARATGDPEKIEQAEAFAASVRKIGYSIQEATDFFAEFKDTALDAATDALAEFLDVGISGSKTFKEAFNDMAASVIGALKRLMAELIAAAILKKILGLFGMAGGGETGGGSDVNPETAVPPGEASGGLFHGAGTGTSDSNVIRISDEEFIVRAAVVRQPGVLRHLRNLNRDGVRSLHARPAMIDVPATRFAEGGLVEGGGAGAGGETLNGHLVLGLEDGLVLREMDTAAGQKVLVRALSNNRRAVRSALGI